MPNGAADPKGIHMSPSPGGGRANRRHVLIGGGVLVLVIALVAVWLAARAGSSTDPSSSPRSSSPSPGASASPGPTLSPKPSSSSRPGGAASRSPDPNGKMNSAKPQQVRF